MENFWNRKNIDVLVYGKDIRPSRWEVAKFFKISPLRVRYLRLNPGDVEEVYKEDGGRKLCSRVVITESAPEDDRIWMGSRQAKVFRYIPERKSAQWKR